MNDWISVCVSGCKVVSTLPEHSSITAKSFSSSN